MDPCLSVFSVNKGELPNLRVHDKTAGLLVQKATDVVFFSVASVFQPVFLLVILCHVLTTGKVQTFTGIQSPRWMTWDAGHTHPILTLPVSVPRPLSGLELRRIGTWEPVSGRQGGMEGFWASSHCYIGLYLQNTDPKTKLLKSSIWQPQNIKPQAQCQWVQSCPRALGYCLACDGEWKYMKA